jgi:hypothetical protein
MKQLEQFNLLKQQHVIGVSPVRVQDGIGDQEQAALNPLSQTPVDDK